MTPIQEEIIFKALNDKGEVLSSTHSKLSLPIINRIYRKMINGIRFDDIKVCDNLIIDGHHRYISSICADVEIGIINSLKTSAILEYKWQDVQFLDEEWDTAQKIKRLNQLDAKYNNIPIEDIAKMIE